MNRRSIRLLVALILLTCPVASRGADEVVSNCSTDAELRAKLDSMQSSDGGTLTFACGAPSEIMMTPAALPEILQTTTIDGGGTVTLNGGCTGHRIFEVGFAGNLSLRRIKLTNACSGSLHGGAISNEGALALDDVEITDSGPSPIGRGGAIYTTSLSLLTIANSRFTGNFAGSGGAIYADGTFSPLTITNSVFSDNGTIEDEDTSGWGGAILLLGTEASIQGGEIRDNEARTGGAIVGWELSSVVINGTVIRDNKARNGPGGAMRIGEGPGSNASATLTDVTMSGNIAEGALLAFPTGGGIHCDGCALTLERSTLVLNSATNRGGGVYLTNPLPSTTLVNVTLASNVGSLGGGGLYVGNGAIELTNVTFANNQSSAGSGGGIGSLSSSVGLRNVLMANFNDDCDFTSPVGTPVNESNLSTDDTCAFGPGRDNIPSPSLVLQDNGGPTETILFDADSPTVDAGTLTGCPATDQRGAPRPFGDSCDVGATEFGAVVPTTTTTTTTLPSSCDAECVTTDPCRPKACVQGACVTEDRVGLDGATCACQRTAPSECANQVPPPKVLKPAAKACELLNVAAAAAPGKRRVKKLKMARIKWQAATRLVGKKPAQRVLTAECRAALAADYADAASRVGAALP